jgi:hypothetical protein
MWSRASGLSDKALATFHPEDDLVQVRYVISIPCSSLSSEINIDHRSGVVSYGTILLGKLRIPAVNDSKGEGFVHVRYVSDVIFLFSSRNDFVQRP